MAASCERGNVPSGSIEYMVCGKSNFFLGASSVSIRQYLDDYNHIFDYSCLHC